jgi:hypothetical protein
MATTLSDRAAGTLRRTLDQARDAIARAQQRPHPVHDPTNVIPSRHALRDCRDEVLALRLTLEIVAALVDDARALVPLSRHPQE